LDDILVLQNVVFSHSLRLVLHTEKQKKRSLVRRARIFSEYTTAYSIRRTWNNAQEN
jgi:hypothetical protein